jgi:hypothetical protein
MHQHADPIAGSAFFPDGCAFMDTVYGKDAFGHWRCFHVSLRKV